MYNYTINKKFTFLQMIIHIWNNLEKELNSMNIDKITIFLNLFIKLLPEYLFQYDIKNIKNKGEADLAKNFFKKLVDICINKYPDYQNFYIDYDMKEIIQERNSPLIYNDSIYPYMKYFIINAHPKIKFIKNEIQKKKDDHLLLYSLFNVENYHILDNLENFNESINNLIDFFSYIKKNSSKNVNNIKSNKLSKLISNFTKDTFKKKIRECSINEINKIIMDEYKCFIKAQNNIIKIGINYDLSFRRIFRRINIQDALYNDILKFDLKSFDEYDSFHTLFYNIKNKKILIISHKLYISIVTSSCGFKSDKIKKVSSDCLSLIIFN
jgi:hypothetical protein